MPTTVSFVIVNYNGAECLGPCLHSIFEQSRLPDEVIVVDNHSADGSLGLIQPRYRDRIKVIELKNNVGYPAACNIGFENSTGDLVAMLNNDIRLDRDWLRTLLARDSAEWSFWASRIVFDSDPGLIDSAGDGMAVVGSAYKIGHGDLAKLYREPREVFGPCAAAALYRRSLLQETGGFDEDFFLIYEDADLNFRARLLGHRCLYVPQATVRHQVNASIGVFSDTYVFYGHRNSEYVFWKNMPAKLLCLYLPERILFNIASFVYFSLRGRGYSFLRSKWAFLRAFKQVLQKRREIQSTRRLNTRKVRELLDRNWLRFRRKALRKR